jgi:hypothetical protein
MVLSDELVERTRSHPCGKRLAGIRAAELGDGRLRPRPGGIRTGRKQR